MEIDKLISLAQHYFATNNLNYAETYLKKAISIDEDNLIANEIIGQLFFYKNQFIEAIHHLKKACHSNKCSNQSFYLLGSALLQAGQAKEAVNYFELLIIRNGDSFQVLHDLATCYATIGKFDASLSLYNKCLSLDPNSPYLHYNIGRLYDELGSYQNALDSYNSTIQLDPNFSYAYANKAGALVELKRYDEAIIFFNQALKLNPNLDWVAGDLLHIKMKICSWSGLAESLAGISRNVLANKKFVQPFPLLALNNDALLHKKSAEIYAINKYPPNYLLGPIAKRPKIQKIRIGYFSADFYNHATGYLIAELFELHNKSQFELFGFSFGPIANDEMHQRLKKSFDHFIEVGEKSDIEVARLSRDLNIDIAVDLKGFTQHARTRIFAYRAAPIQVNYLGYPGTMGTDYMDYIIADITLIPPESQSYYSEKVVYLPGSYQVNDRKRLISHRRFDRQDLGLPEDGFVFCCFNNNFKILPSTFEGWMRILKAVEGSVLWLFQDNLWAAENLKKEAEKQGIAAARLVFAERLPLPEHLARHRQADLFLDTFPWNAHTTTSDALWAGLPVLTLMGQSFASRVAASLLNAIDLPELITKTQEEYESLAIGLALNPNKLTEIKKKLASRHSTSSLFNTPLFTKNLEAAYIKMTDRYQADLQPDHIHISE